MDEEEEENGVYQADTYTDAELLEFLDMSPSATDRELEAKIVQMINQYPEPRIQSFFKDVYRRFFDVDLLDDADADADADEASGKEGMANRSESITVLKDKTTTKDQVQRVEQDTVSKAKAALTASDEMYGKVDPRLMQSVVLTKGLQYASDPTGLNPTLNNTIQRVMIIDSRCRDRTIYKSSTDFTLNLSENLKHVLALNFYYVNVPYTWYTISKAYGANLIFLNGNQPGISSVGYALRISIEPGNYTTPEALVKAVDAAIKTLAAVRTDISFGNSGITLTSNTAGSGKATFTWDIQNRLGDSNYSLVFPFWTSSADQTPTTLNNSQTFMSKISIPGFLGFLQNNTYALSSIVSDFEYAYQAGDIDLDESLFEVDADNNTFFIFNHAPMATIDSMDKTVYYDKIKVTIPTGPGNRSDLMRKVNVALQASIFLDPVRSVLDFASTTFTNTSTDGPLLDYVQRFRMTIQLNRFQTQNRLQQCQTIFFPDESLRKTAPVWTGSNSAFYFSSTALPVNSTWSEVGNGTVAIDIGLTSGATYLYASLAMEIRFQCKKYPTSEINDRNSFTVTIPASDNYTLATHLAAINTSIQVTLTHNALTGASRLFYYDYYGSGSNVANQNDSNETVRESAVYAEFGFQESFDYTHFTVNAAGSFLCTYFGFPETMDFTTNTNVYETTFSLRPDGYLVNNDNRKLTVASKGGEEPSITVYMPYCPRINPTTNKNNSHNGAFYRYPDLASLQQAINNGQYGFLQYQNKTSIYQVAAGGTVPLLLDKIPESQQDLYGLNLSRCKIEFTKVSDTKAKCKLTWNISNSLSEQDYRVELMGDSWSLLGFTSFTSFVLSDLTWSPVGSTVATIYAERDVITSTISIVDSSFPGLRVQNNQLCVQPNANAESLSSTADLITVSIDPGLYNRFSLVRALNAALDANLVTQGTRFVWCDDDLENVRIDWNINKVYRAEDYTLTFFDLYEFGHCEPHTTGNSSLTAIRWDQTLGWLLGYRSLTSYNMTESVATSSDPDIGYSTTNVYVRGDYREVSIEGDTPVNVYLYNQLHVVLDDFTGNHMNDGIVTVAPPNAETTLPSYANRAQQRCDIQPGVRGAGGKAVPGFVNTQPTDTLGKAAPLLSENLLYAAVAKWEAQRNLQNSVAKTQSPSPNVKDMFALIPLKLPGLQVGQTYTEFGGTLQQNNRKYFGPVTIRRLGIKLVSDRGDVVDLNNNDWSVGIICDISIQQRS